MTDDSSPNRAQTAVSQFEESIADVRAALVSLKYGNINITVHEGRVVQIDVTEKKRVRPS